MRERKGKGNNTEEFHPSKIKESIYRTPDTVLHTRRDPQGRKAFEVLDAAQIHFRIKLDRSPTEEIYVAWGEKEPNPERNRHPEGDEGVLYMGEEGIDFFIGMIRTVFRATAEEISNKSPSQADPASVKWLENIMQQQRIRNRELMYPERQC